MGNPCKNISLSKLQSPITTQWLHDNYEMLEGVSLPRIALYTHYLDFCNHSNVTPVNAASFGKIIRNTFPELKTRRLGTRGKSKYHYFGICIKQTSVYYEKTIPLTHHYKSQSGPAPAESCKKNDIKSNLSESSREHENALITNGALLPSFPSFDSLVEDEPTLDKVKTFLIMYRAHCQRILDTIFRANFAEVQNFLIHFWQGMPPHIAVVLSNKNVIDLIKSCDVILYKAVTSVLIPSSLQPLPSSLSQAIQHFAKQLPISLELALYHLPCDLQIKKLSAAKMFARSLLRQTSLSHLAQASKTVLHNTEHLSQMIADMRGIKSEDICKYTTFISYGKVERDTTLVEKFFSEFDDLFERQATIEEYTYWISSIVSRCVIKPSKNDVEKFQSLAQEFLLKWTYVTSKIIQELTLRSAKSFGSFHLVLMFFDDYIFYLIESHFDINEIESTKKNLSRVQCNDDSFGTRLQHSVQLRNSVLLGNTYNHMIPCTDPYQQPIFEEPSKYSEFNFNENSYVNLGHHASISMSENSQLDQHYVDIKLAQDLPERTKPFFDTYDNLTPRFEFYGRRLNNSPY